MKLAGVVLDFYDDPSGSVLRQSVPDIAAVPELIKNAHFLKPEEREVLRDEAFALIMIDNGHVFRKFACVDAGNTLLSMMYFQEKKELLPEDAQKMCEANLQKWAQVYGLDKAAAKGDEATVPSRTGKGRLRDPMNQPMVGDEADWSARTNLTSVRGGADSGRVIPTANQMKTAAEKKANGDMLQYFADHPEKLKEKKERDAKKKKAEMEKVSEKPQGGMTLTNDTKVNGVTAKQPDLMNKKEVIKAVVDTRMQESGTLEKNISHAELQGWHGLDRLDNVVDISGKSPKAKLVKKAAERHALGDRYPLDTFADVKAAVRYFEEYYHQMDPPDRHEYAVKTAARADELGIDTTKVLERYGSTGYADDVEAHLASRRAALSNDKEAHELYNELQEKRASIDPERFAELLGEADVVTGVTPHYGGLVMDPYFSTFGGMRKEAQASDSWSFTSRTGDYVNAGMLRKLALNGRKSVHKHFSSEIADAFMKDPIAIFESMPDDHKAILSHMAQDEFDNLPKN